MRASLALPAALRQLDVHRLVLRAALLWLLARIAVVAVSRGGWFVSPTTALILITATTVMSHVDSRAMREPIFYANIGRPTWSAAAAGAVTAALVELVLLLTA